MTDSLIDSNTLGAVIATWTQELEPHITRDVLAYLREVLTPAALEPAEVFVDYDGCNSIRILKGTDLYRRIFGEDQ